MDVVLMLEGTRIKEGAMYIFNEFRDDFLGIK